MFHYSFPGTSITPLGQCLFLGAGRYQLTTKGQNGSQSSCSWQLQGHDHGKQLCGPTVEHSHPLAMDEDRLHYPGHDLHLSKKAPPNCTVPDPYRLGGDICIGEAPVLAHDGNVAVHIDRLRVAGQHRDPAEKARVNHRAEQGQRQGQRGRDSAYPFSPLLMNFWTSFTPRRICLCLAAATESHREGAAPPRPNPTPAMPRCRPDLS